MQSDFIFNFKTDLSKIDIPSSLNNPFIEETSEISKIAAMEFQEFLKLESQKWAHDFYEQKGKMFGVLVVKKTDSSSLTSSIHYIGTVSGKLPNNIICYKLIPSVFDDSDDIRFIDTGMIALKEITDQISNSKNVINIKSLKEKRKLKSKSLQKILFESYTFLNLSGCEKNLLEIFDASSYGKPPSAAGECAAPKLLHYAFKQGLKPIALSEFWWGISNKSKGRKHKSFYPACKERCRPIIEFMLDDPELYNNAKRLNNKSDK